MCMIHPPPQWTVRWWPFWYYIYLKVFFSMRWRAQIYTFVFEIYHSILLESYKSLILVLWAETKTELKPRHHWHRHYTRCRKGWCLKCIRNVFIFQVEMTSSWITVPVMRKYSSELEVLDLENPTRELEIFFQNFEASPSVSSHPNTL